MSVMCRMSRMKNGNLSCYFSQCCLNNFAFCLVHHTCILTKHEFCMKDFLIQIMLNELHAFCRCKIL